MAKGQPKDFHKRSTSELLSVVLVNYCSAPDVIECINSLLRHEIASANQIIVVDNKSPDGSGSILAKELAGITVIQSNKNSGFGGGVNLGASKASTDFILVLNPDTRFTENKINLALDIFNDKNVGVVGLNLQNEDGSLQYSARHFYSALTIALRRLPFLMKGKWKKVNAEHLMANSWKGGAIFDAPWVMGAAFIVRKSAFEKIGGMDEKFFLYLEDTDLCRRMWRGGYRVKAINDVQVLHVHQRASAKNFFSRSNKAHFTSLLRYVYKYGLPIFDHDKRP